MSLPPPQDSGPPPNGGGDPGPPPQGGHDPGPPKLTREMLGYFWKYLLPDRGKMWLTLAVLVVLGALPALMGLLPKIMTENWHPDRVHTLWWALGGLLTLAIFANGLQFLLQYLTAGVAQNFGRRLRLSIFEKIGKLPTLSLNFQSVGALAYRNTSDVFRIQSLLTPMLPMALSNAAQLFFMLISLLWLGWEFTLLGLAIVPVVWFLVSRLNRKLRSLARSGQQQGEEIMTGFIEGVGGYRDLVAAGRFKEAAQAFDNRLLNFRRNSIATSMVNSWTSAIPLLAFSLLIFGYYFNRLTDTTMVGNMEYLGRVLSFAGIAGMVQGPALSMSRFFTEMSLSATSFHEVRKLLDSPEVPDVAGGGAPASSDITLENVTFTYGQGAPPILNGISCMIPAGSFTAIVGQTGSGKSTLFYLLLRLLDPTSGELRIGEKPLSQISLAALRDYVGFIPQSPFIFDASIRENLCMGDSEEPARVEEAIRKARLERLVENRKGAGGMEARVGPGGATLSGGERQRVALGRIFLRDPQIVICDEYTANIDNATARLIHETLATVFAGKTRVVITHQLYTVRGADQILVLDKGRIVDKGTHEELLQRGGLYREMWEVQRLD